MGRIYGKLAAYAITDYDNLIPKTKDTRSKHNLTASMGCFLLVLNLHIREKLVSCFLDIPDQFNTRSTQGQKYH